MREHLKQSSESYNHEISRPYTPDCEVRPMTSMDLLLNAWVITSEYDQQTQTLWFNDYYNAPLDNVLTDYVYTSRDCSKVTSLHDLLTKGFYSDYMRVLFIAYDMLLDQPAEEYAAKEAVLAELMCEELIGVDEEGKHIYRAIPGKTPCSLVGITIGPKPEGYELRLEREMKNAAESNITI